MVNKEAFIKRLEHVLEFYGLSASAFADSIGVQRSSISHLLSGRNNPSLDFILKILHQYPDVELYWLLNGKGTFPLEESKQSDSQSNIEPLLRSDISTQQTAPTVEPDTLFSSQNKSIARIVVFYKDGTFEEYKNE